MQLTGRVQLEDCLLGGTGGSVDLNAEKKTSQSVRVGKRVAVKVFLFLFVAKRKLLVSD